MGPINPLNITALYSEGGWARVGFRYIGNALLSVCCVAEGRYICLTKNESKTALALIRM